MTSAWPTVAADLRRALLRTGRSESATERVLDALRPIVLAVERVGTRIDVDVAWALLAVAADRQRRRAQEMRRMSDNL